jgi:hypothetical protein
MSFIMVRDFKCSLCQQQFSLLAGDLMPGPFFCDDCLREVWSLEDEKLKKHVANCLDEKENIPFERIILNIQQYKRGEMGIEEIIAQRERQRNGSFL